jgi:hypothetical protein
MVSRGRKTARQKKRRDDLVSLLKRRDPYRKSIPRLLIVCEGQTEVEYFQEWRVKARASSVSIVIELAGVPKTVVEKAVRLKKEAEAEAVKSKDDGHQFRKVWAIFDRDDHPNIPEAFDQATANGIDVAFSDPCFEIWLLLHHQDHRAAIARESLFKLCDKCMPGYAKKAPFNDLYPNYSTAKQRAVKLRKWQQQQGRSHSNPWTNADLVCELFAKLLS